MIVGISGSVTERWIVVPTSDAKFAERTISHRHPDYLNHRAPRPPLRGVSGFRMIEVSAHMARLCSYSVEVILLKHLLQLRSIRDSG